MNNTPTYDSPYFRLRLPTCHFRSIAITGRFLSVLAFIEACAQFDDMLFLHNIMLLLVDIQMLIGYSYSRFVLWRVTMPNRSDNHFGTPVRPIPLIPIYALSFVSALTLSLSLRFVHLVRAALLGAAFVFAALAVAYFAWFLLAADESLRAINYRALAFGFVSFLSLAVVLDFLRSLGFHVPVVPTLGIPVSMIVLWTLGLVLAAAWQRSSEGNEE